MSKKILLTAVLLCTLVQWAMAQSTIRGRITEADGDPISGASIRVKGTNRGTLTDNSGNFGIVANSGDDLEISAVGYTKVTVDAQPGMVVKLNKDTKSINEVVVTALGIKRNKAELGYAATRVGGNEVTNTRQSNVFNSLAGKVAGLDIKTNNQMGGSTNVVIRGYKSIAGSNQALIVVDGIPYDNSITNTLDQRRARGGYDYGNAGADINPDDIASINVLRGPAATALYGARGANGVILIETRKGRKGFNLSVSTGVTGGSLVKSTFAKYQNEYGAGYFNSFRTAFDVDGDGIKDTMARTNHDASFGPAFDPNKYVYDWVSLDPSSPDYLKKRPWVNAANGPATFLQNTLALSNSVVLTSGNDKSNVKIAYTRNDEKGMLPNSNINKNLFSVSAGQNINDRLTAGVSANTSIVNALGRYGTGYEGNNLMTNFRQWWQTNADIKELRAAYDRTGGAGVNTTWNWYRHDILSPAYWDNPYWVRYKNFSSDNRNRFFGNTFLSYNANSWLNFLARASMDTYNEFQEERKEVNSQTSDGTPYYKRFDRTFKEMNYDFIANLNKSLTKEVQLKGLVGYNFNTQNVNAIRSETNGGLNIPGIFALSNSLNPINAPFENPTRRQIRGWYANANIGFRDILFWDGTIRLDKSSTLPAGRNSYAYPSTSLTYLFSKIVNKPWLNYGKARLSFAGVGADAPFASTDDYYSANTSFGSTPLFFAQTTKANPNLKPERTGSYEAGVELGMLKNRVNLDATYYIANSINQIIAIPVSTATGYSRKFINAGNIRNQGIEMTLGLKPIVSRNFTWDVNINWTRNRNKVVALADSVDNIVLGTFQSGVSLNAALGRPYGEIRGSDFIYKNGQRVVDSVTGAYLRTPDFNQTIGNINPDWIGGILNSFTYKNVKFSFLIDTKMGGSVYSLDQFYGVTTGIYDYSTGSNPDGSKWREEGIILPGVKENGEKNNVKYPYDAFMEYPNAYSVYDASFVKLREMTLGYSLPSKYFARSKVLKGIDFSLFGRNLGILYKNLPYADPEDGQSSGNLQGFQSGTYPMYRLYGFNTKFNF